MKTPDPTRETYDALLDELADLRSANELLHGLITNRDTEIERLRAELALYKQNYARKQLTDSERRALEGK